MSALTKSTHLTYNFSSFVALFSTKVQLLRELNS